MDDVFSDTLFNVDEALASDPRAGDDWIYLSTLTSKKATIDIPQSPDQALPPAPKSAAQSFRLSDADLAMQHAMRSVEGAQAHLKAVDQLRIEIFGSLDAYQEFSGQVERRLEVDEAFAKKHQHLMQVHEHVVSQMAGDQTKYTVAQHMPKKLSPKKQASNVFIPGQPVVAPTDVGTRRQNHFLGKDMI